MATRKLWSVLLAWNDNDAKEGEYAILVCASNAERAERRARAKMRADYIDQYRSDPDDDIGDLEPAESFGGRVIDIQEGAIWRALDIERALRRILSAKSARTKTAAEIAARDLLASIEKGAT